MLKVSLSLISAFVLSTTMLACAPTVRQEVDKAIETKVEEVKAPVARVFPSTKVYGTDNYVDNYAWLRNKNDPAVISYLQEENKYTEEKLKSTKDFQNNLYNEMLSRIKENDSSVPVRKGNYYYYTKTEAGKQYRIYCRKYYSLDAAEQVILDPNAMVGDSKYFSVGAFDVSPNGKYLAYSIDKDGSEAHTLYIKNLETNSLYPEEIPNTSPSVEWANDNQTLFYVTLDNAKRPFQAYRHRLTTDYKMDQLVYHERDESFYLGLGKSKNDSYIFINSGSQITSEVRYIDANKPMSVVNLVLPKKYGVEYYVENRDKAFYILTNDNAPNFKLVVAPITDPTQKNWREIIPQWDTVKIDSFDVFRDFLVVNEREEGIKKILVINMKTFDLKHVEMPETVYDVSTSQNPNYDSSVLRYEYESLTTPHSVYDYNMYSDTKSLLKQNEVLGGYNPNDYEAERVNATASDGTMVPISIVRKKTTPKDGTAPLYLYAYGSYGASMDPYFDSTRLSLLNRGITFAIAHIRGGGDLGRKWYEDGKFLKKKNTFTDFISAAEYLIAQKYTSKDKLVISGGSAGGLLMGAVTNMRPDLFKGVIADVPFVDVINTMMDPTLPLTVIEYDEWGDPNKKEFYDYMKSYSPYDNITPKAYPNMLVTAGLNDPRVGFWEPAKYVAKLRATKTDNNLLLLNTNMGAGHGGASGRYDYLREKALEYAFIYNILGMPNGVMTPTPVASPATNSALPVQKTN